jgi:ATP phosphoribosyltransferase
LTFLFNIRREALQKWKQANGAAATYRNLIGVFEKAGYKGYADTVCNIISPGE